MIAVIKNYEEGVDVDNIDITQFLCKIYGPSIINETTISGEQYIKFAKDLLKAIREAREIGD
jgi:hypothetical protein